MNLSMNLSMNCEYFPIDNREEKALYRCAVCGHERASRHQPEHLHRQCGTRTLQQVAAPADDMACQHRGEQIGERTCEQCGQRGKKAPVFACAIYGECTLRKWTNRGQTEKVCFSCHLRDKPLFNDAGHLLL